MKRKSERYPYVKFQRWTTPLSGYRSSDLYLDGVLQTGFQVFLFLHKREKYNKESYVLSFPRGYPYRIMEEEYAWVGIDRYFKPKDPNVVRKRKRSAPCSTWKFWNTDMIQELDAGDALSGYGQIKPNDVIEYVVLTANDIIEILSPAIRWTRYVDIKASRLIALYAKKKFREPFGEPKSLRT